jgi:hypothetical protein
VPGRLTHTCKATQLPTRCPTSAPIPAPAPAPNRTPAPPWMRQSSSPPVAQYSSVHLGKEDTAPAPAPTSAPNHAGCRAIQLRF